MLLFIVMFVCWLCQIKKGVKPSVTRLNSRLPPSDLTRNKQWIVHTQSGWTPSLLVLACRKLAVFGIKRTRAKSSISIFIKNERDALINSEFWIINSEWFSDVITITNLHESVCPGLLHRQFVLFVNTIIVYCDKIIKNLWNTKHSVRLFLFVSVLSLIPKFAHVLLIVLFAVRTLTKNFSFWIYLCFPLLSEGVGSWT